MTVILVVYRVFMTVAGLLFATWFDNAFLVSVAAGIFVYQLVAMVRLARYLQRASQPGVERKLENDSRPPVLFLRPFTIDELVLSPFSIGWRGFEYLLSMERRTFEEYLARAFEEVGPVIAIGRPGEVAAPIGAAREYLDDALWQQRVLERAEAARLIIMVCDATPGMKWEIANVPQRVGLRRILLFLPVDESGEAMRSAEWYERWDRLVNEFRFLPEVREDTIAVVFNESGVPILVSANNASLQERIMVTRDAWLKSPG
jgi:hypothetical protein